VIAVLNKRINYVQHAQAEDNIFRSCSIVSTVVVLETWRGGRSSPLIHVASTLIPYTLSWFKVGWLVQRINT